MGCNTINFSTSPSWTIGIPNQSNTKAQARGSSPLSVSVTRRQLQLPSASSFPLRFIRDDFSSASTRSNSYFRSHSSIVKAEAQTEPLRIMISGAPASGKGTQCQLITSKYGLVHVSAGDLLRAEISTGSENGKRAKEYMEKGQLVPDEIVVMMVKERLLKPDSVENGWLLDGYPRSLSQATALKEIGFVPDIFILLEETLHLKFLTDPTQHLSNIYSNASINDMYNYAVTLKLQEAIALNCKKGQSSFYYNLQINFQVSENILVERVVGRRLDPVTGQIYHLKYSPPETKEIAERLTQRFDDTEEKVKLRLNTHHQNVEAVLSMYKDITVRVDGNASKEEVFGQIDGALTTLLEQRKAASESVVA